MELARPDQVEAMLEEVGLSPDELFKDVPPPVRRGLDLPEGKSDRQVEAHVRETLADNRTMDDQITFLGGGSYRHWLPPETRYMATRGELLTAYTPYQAEINQGLLQALFEFQTMATRLLELDVANTGMYDGATAAAEAVTMAMRVTRGRDRVLVPEHLPAQRRSILENYATGAGAQFTAVPTDPDAGTVDRAVLEDELDEDVACVHLESPNAYGRLEPLDAAADLAHDVGAKLTVNVPEVTALGLVHGPGHYGADAATAEGQPLALPPSFGGPALGLFASREDHLRKTPGRLVGQTEDQAGETSYCMTLQTREQHIRRSRATSNICTNQSFLAVLFTASLASYGETGFRDLARANKAKGDELAEALADAGAEVPFRGTPGYNEVLYRPPTDAATFRETAREHGIDPGVPAGDLLGDGEAGLVACVTETTPDGAIDRLAGLVEEVA
jgi:glycine dehydrogenase subunit 1